MVSFSLRLRISYLLLQDSSLVSFHLIQFASRLVRIVRLATALRASMLGAGRTGLMGAARPQTPRRSPRQAFGGNS